MLNPHTLIAIITTHGRRSDRAHGSGRGKLKGSARDRIRTSFNEDYRIAVNLHVTIKQTNSDMVVHAGINTVNTIIAHMWLVST